MHAAQASQWLRSHSGDRSSHNNNYNSIYFFLFFFTAATAATSGSIHSEATSQA